MTKPQTKTDLDRHLREQVRFLERSADAFDSGDESESKRLATHIRLLVHDTSNSHSLLGLLELKHTLRYEDTTIRKVELPPGYDQLPPGAVVLHSGIAVTQLSSGPNGVRFVAPLDELSPERVGPPVKFEEWWEPEIIRDTRGNPFSRKTLVLALANQDGGAHVDPQLGDAYAALTKENSLGRWGSDAEGAQRPLDNLALASVRQVAHELEKTLKKQVPQILGLN